MISIYLGKRKAVPFANPSITWEGDFGAAFITTIVSYFIYHYFTPLDVTFGILSGVLISLNGFFCSLTISVLKLDLLIGDNKKFNTLKKSYLNRVDSLTYTSPVFFSCHSVFFDFM